MEEHEFDQWCAAGNFTFDENDHDIEGEFLGYVKSELPGFDDDDDELDLISMTLEERPEKEVIEPEVVPIPGLERATPLEELMLTVGVVNVKKQYWRAQRERVMHDFRWLADPEDLVFRGERVIAVIFPPAKLDLAPQAIIGNMSIREGNYVTVTGNGSHLFMGAIPATPEVSCVCAIVTRKTEAFFELTRTTVRETDGPVRAWTPRGEFFSVARAISWNDRLENGDNIVMIDGDVWYYPAKREPVVTVQSGKIVDRKGRELDSGVWAVADGQYAFDIDAKTFSDKVERPPVSFETFCAWRKLKRLPTVMYGVKKQHDRFEIDPADYDPQDKGSLIANPKLRSLAMMKRQDKYREQCKVTFLRTVSRNIYAFNVYEMSAGRCWIDHEVTRMYIVPTAAREVVLSVEGRHLSREWQRVVVDPSVVGSVLREMRARGDIVVTKCEESRARGYCGSEWCKEQMRKMNILVAKCWHNPLKIARAVVEMWMEYYGPPEEVRDEIVFVNA